MIAPRRTELGHPIFVVGYMHSGTTLLLKILGRHSTVFAGGGETKFFECLPMIRHAYPDLANDETLRRYVAFVLGIVERGFRMDPAAAQGDTNGRATLDDGQFAELFAQAQRQRDYTAIFRLASDHLARLAGKGRWLEKTPTHVLQIDQIIDSVPGALFVEIVRDPRDVLASKKTRRASVWASDRFAPEQRSFKHLEKAYDPLWDSLSWKSAVRAGHGAQRRHAGRVFSLRYEDLVAAPEQHVRAVCEFLGLEFEPGMLQVAARNSAERGEVTGEGIAADAVGRWRRTLTPAETALCQSLLKAELDRLEYARVDTDLAARARMPALAAKSLFEFSQRLSRRWRMGGTIYSLNVLGVYWKRLLKLVHN
ncbi:MAG: sulfotransferase family protein [Pyrinomonadaceae bacterium]